MSAPLLSSRLMTMSLQIAIPCLATTASIACSSSRKLRSQVLLISERSESIEPAIASHRDQVGASGSRFIQSKWMSGYCKSSAGRLMVSFDNIFGLQTGQKLSRKISRAIKSVGMRRAYRIATSASPPRKSSTESVPMTSSGTSGCASRHRGRRGINHRLANAFGLVTRKGCCSAPGGDRCNRRDERHRGHSAAPGDVRLRLGARAAAVVAETEVVRKCRCRRWPLCAPSRLPPGI